VHISSDSDKAANNTVTEGAWLRLGIVVMTYPGTFGSSTSVHSYTAITTQLQLFLALGLLEI